MKGFIIGSGVVVGLLAGLVFAFDKAASMPDVYVSYATNECVKVVNYTDEKFACDNLPKRYNHVWAQ